MYVDMGNHAKNNRKALVKKGNSFTKVPYVAPSDKAVVHKAKVLTTQDVIDNRCNAYTFLSL